MSSNNTSTAVSTIAGEGNGSELKKKFDVPIKRDVNVDELAWPDPDEVDEEGNPGLNRLYTDLRGMPWSEAERIYQCESDIITKLKRAEDSENEIDFIEDELYDDPDGGIYGLDAGVASTVIALSAAGYIPISSCNASAFDGTRRHYEEYPLVAFYARPEWIPNLMKCAEAAHVGLNTDDGLLVVYADDIQNMRRFAHTLIANSAVFDSLRSN